ncbi:hypothetical protein KBI23_01460 [bacterium]|nr:hypothetical protein [bacterium]MBP9807058.1 hypothetical protein [bacterium]
MNDLKSSKTSKVRDQYLVAIDGCLALSAVLLVVQMWLLTASLEAHLSGHQNSALPGAIFSSLLFASNVGLYLFVQNIERRARKKGL